jgi:hypothetical protein
MWWVTQSALQHIGDHLVWPAGDGQQVQVAGKGCGGGLAIWRSFPRIGGGETRRGWLLLPPLLLVHAASRTLWSSMNSTLGSVLSSFGSTSTAPRLSRLRWLDNTRSVTAAISG